MFFFLSFASVPLSANFNPTLLKLSASDNIQYAFDGTTLSIPVTVTGTNAGLVFSVFTKGKADEIGVVRNGYLGWHYVNKVDTCIYYSSINNFGTGDNIITWDGRDNEERTVSPGEYTYYMWAFDKVGYKVKMMNYTYTGFFQEVDADGAPLANPIYYSSNWRWTVGDEPLDTTLRIASSIPAIPGWSRSGSLIDPHDFKYVYYNYLNNTSGAGSILKYKFVAGGDAEMQTDFGNGGFADIYSRGTGGSIGVKTDGEYLFTADENHVASIQPDAQFYIYDYDGDLIEEIDLEDWWSDSASGEAGAQINGGPNQCFVRHGKVFLSCHCSCLFACADPQRYLDTMNLEDFTVWVNGNGDFTGDHNFDETADLKWICMDYNVGPYAYTTVADDNLFTMFNAYDVGAVSFGMFAPDGTGLGYYQYAGETAGWKRSTRIIDSNTAFDGLYPCNRQAGGSQYDGWVTKGEETNGTYFIGHDSITGTITSGDVPQAQTSAVLTATVSETVEPGTNFTVDVNIENVTLLFGASFVLNWTQGNYIDAVSIEEGNFLGLGSDTIFYGTIAEEGGTVSVGVTVKDGQPSISGTGTLARITFLAKNTTPQGTVVSFTLSDMDANTSDGIPINLTAGNCSTRFSSDIVVWPGDTNNDGTVNQADILPIDLNWARTGCSRTVSSIAWSGQICQAWSPTGSTYADCNGNGVVNQSDILPIGLNWGKTHVFSNVYAKSSVAGTSIQPTTGTHLPLSAGAEFWVDIDVESADNLFGLSFILNWSGSEGLEAVSAEAGDLMDSDSIFFPHIENDNVAIGMSFKSGSEPASGNGTAARIKFRANQEILDTAVITLLCDDLCANNSAGESIEIEAREGYIQALPTAVDDKPHGHFALLQNYPNPFNPTTTIPFTLPEAGNVVIKIYAVNGAEVATLVDGNYTAGEHAVEWNASGMANGVYLCRLTSGKFTETHKLTVMK